MCVIVDASVAGLVFTVPYKAEYVPLWRWIEERDGKIVYGGKLADELGRVPTARKRLVKLKQAGLALFFPGKKVATKEKAVRKSGLCRSNDPHVIALALVSGARVLCADDRDLETDFTNRQLVPNIGKQQGKIYKNAGHQHVLKHNSRCKSFFNRR
ncbi:MAG: hypothetical protein K8R46_09930 [Pirellulales bacterium]|nr:hypothetical protein [Pirellulales bacterium]